MSSDYLMRQIEDMARFFASVIFAKRPATLDLVDEAGSISEGSLLWVRLRGLLREDKVNDAENLLFEAIDEEQRDEYMAVAVDFYKELKSWPPQRLQAAGFTHQEIADGLRAVGRRYGIQPDAAGEPECGE